MKTHIAIAILLLATTRLVAQNVDAEQLDLTSLGFTVSGSDSVLALDDDLVPWGWNWLSADGDISRTMGMNFHHSHDPFTWRVAADSNFRFTRVPAQRLASTVNGISVTSQSGRNQFMVPSEAISLEWSPWLIPSGDTMALNMADSLGSVFGFRYRDSRGNVRILGHDLSLRYNLDTSRFTGPTLVLYDTEFGESLSRWRPSDINFVNDNLGYNTDTLWLAVHVRRASNDTDSTHQLDDVVLRIRVPYWLASECQDANGDSSLARFRWIPVAENGEENVSSTLSRAMGRRWRVDSTDTAPTEIVITRRMLPAYSSNNGDITIYAMMLFNYDFGEDAQDNTWNNPYVNTHVEFNTTKVKRLSVDVVYEDNLDVDIKWIRLESSEARRLFWGQRDLTIRNAVSTFMANLRRYNRDSVAVPGEQPRLWRIYGRDEIRLMHWKGFRYINRMLHDYVTTEWEVAHYSRARHCLRLREYWQGQGGALQWHDNIASPTFRHGVTQWRNIADSANMYLGLGKGRFDQPDFETHAYGSFRDSMCLNPDTYQTWTQALPMPTDSARYYLSGYSGGVQTRVDHMLYEYMFRERSMLFSPGRKWLSNVWTYSAVQAYPDNNSEGRRLRFTSNGRPKSAEEMRLQMWLPLVLGAKGLVFYCGTSDTLRTNASFWQDPDDPMIADIGCAAHIASAFTISATGLSRILTDSMGTDYLQSNEHGNLDDYVTNGLATTSLAFHANASGDPGVYVGRKAMRQVMLEVLHGITPYSNVLNDLQLVGWRAKGFREWFLGDSTTAYDHWLWRHRDSQRVGKLAVTILHGTTPMPVSEPYDSTFYDVTVFRAGDTAITDVAYVGVVNRRTDPRVDTTDGGDFRTYEEFKDYVDNEPDSLFAQHGSRRIRLPFRYDHSSGRYHNLRVTELRADSGWGVATNYYPRIDTIIGQDKPLDVDLLPGEGKIFRVTPVPATQETGAMGFLAHSNQRKMVLFPEVDTMITVTDTVTSRTYGRIVVGDSMWYHMVYHRRPVPNAPLTVYYRRSVPYSTNNHPDSSNFIFRNSTIDWEAEINLSQVVVGELFWPAGEDTASTPSAGYPALVVRYDSLEQMSKVYVVYSFEHTNNIAPTNDVLGIAEAVLPAEASHADQLAYLGANAPRLLELVFGNEDDGLPSMWNWGTPMINASRFGNFYCWSRRNGGIRVGFKPPHQRTFFPVGGLQSLPRLTTSYAAHPSMNSYSRLNIGEEDAAVVWHEGTSPEVGGTIAYTRIRFNGAAIDNFLTLGQLASPPVAPYVQPTIDTLSTRIARLSTDSESPGEVFLHRYPSIFRNLSDYPITSANSRHQLGLDNHKGDRIWWETRIQLNTIPTPIVIFDALARRWMDADDWTTCCSASSPPAIDTLAAGQQCFVFEIGRRYRGPEISQGEQTTETGPGVPNPTGAWWGDSVNTVTYWSEDYDGTNQALHHMQFGWNYYGDPNSHQADTLRSRNYLYDLSDPGVYPHAAARYSMSVHPGWSKNRRIYNDLGGQWREGNVAPDITFSSERFFREAAPRERSLRLWHGFRGHDGRSATIADAVLDGDNHPLRFDVRSENETPADVVDEVATEWFSLDGSTELTMKTTSLGEADAALLSVERRSDGARVLVDGAMRSATNITGTNTTGTTQNLARTVAYGLLPDPDEQYRLVLKRAGDVHPVEDIEIVSDDGAMARENTEPLRIVDLRSMDGVTRTSTEQGLSVWPNPASTHVTVVVDRRDDVVKNARTTKSGPRYVVALRDITGRDIFTASCAAIDIVHFDVSELPAGSYAITLSAVDGSAAPEARQLIVITR